MEFVRKEEWRQIVGYPHYSVSNLDGLTYKAIGEQFNVNLTTIYNIVKGNTWKYVKT